MPHPIMFQYKNCFLKKNNTILEKETWGYCSTDNSDSA